MHSDAKDNGSIVTSAFVVLLSIGCEACDPLCPTGSSISPSVPSSLRLLTARPACHRAVCSVPLLFTMYISAVGNVISAHGLCYHKYADDTQVYMAVQRSADTTFESLSMCVDDVARWFLENGLLLNPTKTRKQSCSALQLNGRRLRQRAAST